MKRGRTTPKSTRPTKKARTTISKKAVTRFLELKNYDEVFTARVVMAQTTATAASIFTPDAGTDANEHIGRSVKATSLSYHFHVQFAATTVGAGAIRLAIVFDRQPNAAIATVTDVWNTDAIDTFTNRNNKRRFKVLVDETLDGVCDAGPKSLMIKGYRSFKSPLETVFNTNNAGSVADITTGNYIAYVWQSGGIITASPVSVLSTRVTFNDA